MLVRNQYVLPLLIGLAACSSIKDEPKTTSLPLPKSKQLAPFRLAETQERRFSTEFTLTAGERVIKIEAVPNVGREGAQTMTEDGIMGVQALYANALSPYPGDISKTIVSDARFRPQLVRTNASGREFQYMLLFANDRFGYGGMSADAVRYRSLLGWFYCERAEIFYKVRCFFPLTARPEDLEVLFRSLSCP